MDGSGQRILNLALRSPGTRDISAAINDCMTTLFFPRPVHLSGETRSGCGVLPAGSAPLAGFRTNAGYLHHGRLAFFLPPANEPVCFYQPPAFRASLQKFQ